MWRSKRVRPIAVAGTRAQDDEEAIAAAEQQADRHAERERRADREDLVRLASDDPVRPLEVDARGAGGLGQALGGGHGLVGDVPGDALGGRRHVGRFVGVVVVVELVEPFVVVAMGPATSRSIDVRVLPRHRRPVGPQPVMNRSQPIAGT